MKLNRIMIAAPKSGSGKTTITCAVLQALKNRKEQVVSFKCGPDYIDPMFHKKVIEIASKNLDTFFVGEDTVRELLLKGRAEKEIAVMEGVMGLYDGLGGIREEGSSYHLAKVTKTPIILVVDAKGMGKSVIPLIAGFLAYDTEHLIKGVLLNRMSKSYFDIISPLIEEELKIKVVGYFTEYKNFSLESRHLGLRMPEEYEDIKGKLANLTRQFEKTVSVDEILQIATTAETLDVKSDFCIDENSTGSLDENSISVLKDKKSNPAENKQKPVLAVAKDEAFCFYYEDNLLLLEEAGVELKYFSPLHDKEIPQGCHGLLLGGGYPELYAGELSDNVTMRNSVKEAVMSGMPTVAECGGFMYLHSELVDQEGITHKMADVLSGKCFYTGKLVRFGYIELSENLCVSTPWEIGGKTIKAHEFHYFDSDENGNSFMACKPTTGKTYPCIVSTKSLFCGFPHLYYPSNKDFVKTFVSKIEEYRENR